MDKRIIPKEVRIAAALDRYGSKYDYSKVDKDVCNKSIITLVCNTCGNIFDTTWNRHLHKRTTLGGCSKCGRDACKKVFGDTAEDFISKAIDKHGSRYSYESVQYVSNLSPVTILCYEHGNFNQRPDKHKAGHGCPLCATNGFRSNRRGFLYILNEYDNPNNIKVGITNRLISTRIKEINGISGKFILNWAYTFSNGKMCQTIETSLLKFMNANYNPVDSKFSGSTECFSGAIMEDVVCEAERLIGEIDVK